MTVKHTSSLKIDAHVLFLWPARVVQYVWLAVGLWLKQTSSSNVSSDHVSGIKCSYLFQMAIIKGPMNACHHGLTAPHCFLDLSPRTVSFVCLLNLETIIRTNGDNGELLGPVLVLRDIDDVALGWTHKVVVWRIKKKRKAWYTSSHLVNHCANCVRLGVTCPVYMVELTISWLWLWL